MSELKIPDDLKEHYAECSKYQNAHLILCRQLIERIARLEAALAERDKPVTDEEWLGLCPSGHMQMAEWVPRHDVDALVQKRARKAPGAA